MWGRKESKRSGLFVGESYSWAALGTHGGFALSLLAGYRRGRSESGWVALGSTGSASVYLSSVDPVLTGLKGVNP
jgi:hypothetical protein